MTDTTYRTIQNSVGNSTIMMFVKVRMMHLKEMLHLKDEIIAEKERTITLLEDKTIANATEKATISATPQKGYQFLK